jgi:hypothetical protein
MIALEASAYAAACPGVVTGSYTLTADLTATTTGAYCIIAQGPNTTIDLNGFTISSTTAGQAAITCSAPGITVKDSGSPKGSITGLWWYGIKDCERIQGVEMLGSGATYAVYNAQSRPLEELTDSIIDADTYGVTAYLMGGGSQIVGNSITADNKGIEILGNNNEVTDTPGVAAIEYNVIRLVAYYGIKSVARDVRIRSNMMYDLNLSYPSGTCVDVPAGTPYGQLQCPCGAPYCEAAAAPPYDTFIEPTNNCPGTLTPGGATISLSQDYDLAGGVGPCITLDGAGTLNLNGHYITNSGSVNGTAIECTATGNYSATIQDTATSKGAVDGNFVTGIKSCARIDSVRVMGAMTIGVENSSSADEAHSLDYLRHSVIHAATAAVSTRLNNRHSDISDNSLRASDTGLYVASIRDNTTYTGKATVHNNKLRDAHGVSIDTSGAYYVDLQDNLMYRTDPLDTLGTCLDLNTGNVEDRSLCNCPGQCEGDVAPFAFPLLY